MLGICSAIILGFHLLAVDLAMGAPLACLWLAWRQARYGDLQAGILKRQLAIYSIVALAIAILLGTLQLGLLWWAGDRDFWRATSSIATSRLWFALGELIFFFVAMGIYLWLDRRAKRRPVLQAIVAIMAASNLIYHFPPLFTILGLIAERAELASEPIDTPHYRELLIRPEVLAMVFHVWLAAIGVTGAAILGWALRAGGAPAIILGAARWALAATVAQLPVGVWILLTTSGHTRNSLLGDDWVGAALFAMGILTAVGLLQHLMFVALGDEEPRQIRRCVILTVLTVLLMTAALDRTRWLSRFGSAVQNDNKLFQNRLGEGDSPNLLRRLCKFGTVPDGFEFASKGRT